MKHISVQSFKEIVEAEKDNSSVDFINVCTPSEYKEKHIEGVRNVPFDELKSHKNDFVNKQTVYVHCRSGRRSQQAIETLTSMGVTAELVNVEGGLMAWGEAGLPTFSLTNRMPIMRQTMLAAGLLIITSFVLAWLINPYWLGLALFVGLGLSFAGVTGWCGMTFLLYKLPWNK